jgi:hypothetical protein
MVAATAPMIVMAGLFLFIFISPCRPHLSFLLWPCFFFLLFLSSWQEVAVNKDLIWCSGRRERDAAVTVLRFWWHGHGLAAVDLSDRDGLGFTVMETTALD